MTRNSVSEILFPRFDTINEKTSHMTNGGLPLVIFFTTSKNTDKDKWRTFDVDIYPGGVYDSGKDIYPRGVYLHKEHRQKPKGEFAYGYEEMPALQ